jgi:SAM-dependent methyltransferase
MSTRFLEPSPESAELVRESVGAITPDPDVESWYRSFSIVQSERLAIDLDIVARYVEPGAEILEVGSAPLILTLALARQGYRVAGVDIDPSRFDGTITEHGLRVAGCDVETEPLPFEDASFDAVILNEVLEHLRVNPVAALREARRVVRPGGVLLLSTPNLRSLDGIWNLTVHGRSFAIADNVYDEYQKLERLGHMGHVREYAPGDVEALLSRIGFDVEARVYRNRQRKTSAELVCRIIPQLRRYVSYVARAA